LSTIKVIFFLEEFTRQSV